MAEERENCASASSCGRESCEGCPSRAGAGGPADLRAERNPYSNIKHVIGIVSGKGGVGKTFVMTQLAGMMQRAGYQVGILDADITGPSIPKCYGLHGPAVGDDRGTYPMEAEDGTKLMSINFLLEDEEAPVIWRGPILAGAVKQFWSEVLWGDLDFLFVDMPPGTGDVPLTVFQSLPLDGIIIVTSPQDLVRLIVKKAYHMAGMMDIPVLGLVENYSYLTCPDCGRRIAVFGESKIEETAKEMGLPVLGRLPMNPEFAKLADAGRIYEAKAEFDPAAQRMLEAMQ